jgi:hypothetical protein
MSDWFDMEGEMLQVELDIHTADRMLAGAVAPADAPPGHADVVRLLDAAAGEPSAAELDHRTVAAMASVVRRQPITRTRSIRMTSIRTRSSLAAAAAAAALAAMTSLAFAGSLPGAAQDVASSMLAKVGVTVPGPDEHAGTHPDSRGTSATASDQSGTPSDEQSGDNQSKGEEISALARATDLTGRDKGAAISTLASNGHSHAGNPPGQAGTSSHEHPTGTHGGSGTGVTQSGGASSEGASTADDHSGGRSSSGSGNSAGHEPPTHP